MGNLRTFAHVAANQCMLEPFLRTGTEHHRSLTSHLSEDTIVNRETRARSRYIPSDSTYPWTPPAEGALRSKRPSRVTCKVAHL